MNIPRGMREACAGFLGARFAVRELVPVVLQPCQCGRQTMSRSHCIRLLLIASRYSSCQRAPVLVHVSHEPGDLGHYEAYVFETVDGTPAELDTISQAIEFNWRHLEYPVACDLVIGSNYAL